MNVDFENLAAAQQLAVSLREAGVTDPVRIRPVYERIVALDPFDGDARASLGRTLMARNDAAGGRSRVPRRHRAQAHRSGHRAYRTR